jgi:hypothetical protein
MFNGFVDGVMGTLPPAAALVWVVLWRDTKPSGLARTGIADLARRIGRHRSTVMEGLGVLVDNGLVEIVSRGGIHRGVSTYRVRII